ncbi:MAG: NADH (or F420H2) dehydrogenase subunit C, NADH-quinone oxidoreductase subunit C [Deltaproteobacteria bacterium CSP1-8]|nr:MAG: NADH (or F420H2) dehydrogenase subunit C, NADH-quinone oxidoreductase subunit C [Deltaproteobacteria bacterium CSP1-8]
MAEEKKSAVLETLVGKFGDDIVSTHSDFGDDTALVRRERIVEICTFLRDDPALRFDFAMDLTGVDYLGEEPRFEVVYHLYSLEKKHRVRIKTRVPEEDPVIDSVIPVWAGMDWYEREAYDMYGIVFRNHPNLKRILMYESFVGHPLRKDYPKARRQPTIGPDE